MQRIPTLFVCLHHEPDAANRKPVTSTFTLHRAYISPTTAEPRL